LRSAAFVWIDLRRKPTAPGLFRAHCRSYPAIHITDAAAIGAVTRDSSAAALCFEFDHPDAAGLKALQDTLIGFPALPILMLTEHHSERLAVWALRSGVWDYLVAPPTASELHEHLTALLWAARHVPARLARELPLPLADCLPAGEPRQRTGQATAYIENNIDRKIDLYSVAALCHMSTSQFSRVFKREHGVTFCEYLLKNRVDRARDLLAGSSVPVKNVAFSVGFNDVSYFARVFHRLAGMTPSTFRVMHGAKATKSCAPPRVPARAGQDYFG
jgi:two-component system, response regulator YesN